MKNKNIFIKLPLLVMGLFLVFALGCIKEEVPTVSTTEITNITMSSAMSGGFVEDDGGVGIIDCGICWSTDDNPTIADNKTIDTIGTFGFESSIVGLEANTTYYVRAYATNSVGTGYGNVISFTTPGLGTFTDLRDDNVYTTIQIGEQVWMAENLKYLPEVIGPEIGSNTDAYIYVYGYEGIDVEEAKSTENYATYGVLYNWNAAMNGYMSSETNPSGVQGICPEGWHLPSHDEWEQLCTSLGGNRIAGGKLKEAGNAHWVSPNEGATNEVGFTALPGGFRTRLNTEFATLGEVGAWWTATEYVFANNNEEAYQVLILNKNKSISKQPLCKQLGASIRCVQD